jgi:cytidyltransferase-like protein
MPSETLLPQPPEFLQKIALREKAPQRLSVLPRPVVFTNGVFDVLHRGHVTYLAHARALGGSLVVALNTDASARRLGKGPDRPLNNEQDRAIMMAALESVSLVAETAVVKAYGGKAQAIPFVDGYSTTALVKKIRSTQGGV